MSNINSKIRLLHVHLINLIQHMRWFKFLNFQNFDAVFTGKKKKNVVVTLCLSHNAHSYIPCHIAGASVSCGFRDSSPTRQFTDTYFGDSSPTKLETVHRQIWTQFTDKNIRWQWESCCLFWEKKLKKTEEIIVVSFYSWFL